MQYFTSSEITLYKATTSHFGHLKSIYLLLGEQWQWFSGTIILLIIKGTNTSNKLRAQMATCPATKIQIFIDVPVKIYGNIKSLTHSNSVLNLMTTDGKIKFRKQNIQFREIIISHNTETGPENKWIYTTVRNFYKLCQQLIHKMCHKMPHNTKYSS